MASIYEGKTNEELKELPLLDFSHIEGNWSSGSVPANPFYKEQLIKIMCTPSKKKKA